MLFPRVPSWLHNSAQKQSFKSAIAVSARRLTYSNGRTSTLHIDSIPQGILETWNYRPRYYITIAQTRRSDGFTGQWKNGWQSVCAIESQLIVLHRPYSPFGCPERGVLQFLYIPRFFKRFLKFWQSLNGSSLHYSLWRRRKDETMEHHQSKNQVRLFLSNPYPANSFSFVFF